MIGLTKTGIYLRAHPVLLFLPLAYFFPELFPFGLFALTTNTHSIDLENGSDQYLSETGLDITSDFSVSVWVKLESEPGANLTYFLTSEYDGGIGDEGEGWFLRYFDNAGTKQFDVFYSQTGGNLRSSARYTFTLGTAAWKHIVVTVDISEGGANGIKVYLDNVLQSQASSTAAATSLGSGGAFNIGARGGATTTMWDGLIDEYAIYNDLLTATEVQDLYLQEDSYCTLISSDANLVAYYSLNNVLTSVPAGNDLTNNGSAVFSTTVPFASDSCGGAAAANHWLCMGV